jgi:hypothetical protein
MSAHTLPQAATYTCQQKVPGRVERPVNAKLDMIEFLTQPHPR